jgi:hypothetical protein
MDDVERLLHRAAQVRQYAMDHPVEQPQLKKHPKDCRQHVEVFDPRQRGNGTVAFIGECKYCGTVLHEWLNVRQASVLVEDEANRLRLAPDTDGLGPCHAVDCGNPATVLHHIAFVHIVGQAVADELGVVPYCAYHHQMVHRTAKTA